MTLAMSGATPEDAGLASGLINTTAQVGGAIGLAVLATVSESRTDTLLEEGKPLASALTSGYHVAFWIGAGLVLRRSWSRRPCWRPVPKEAKRRRASRGKPALRSRVAPWHLRDHPRSRRRPARTGSSSRPSCASAVTTWSRRICRPTTSRPAWSRLRRDGGRSDRRRDGSSSWLTRSEASPRRWCCGAPCRAAGAGLRDGAVTGREGRASGGTNTGHAQAFDPRWNDDEIALFLHDAPPELAAAALENGRDQAATPMLEPWPLDAWPDVPTRYLLFATIASTRRVDAGGWCGSGSDRGRRDRWSHCPTSAVRGRSRSGWRSSRIQTKGETWVSR